MRMAVYYANLRLFIAMGLVIVSVCAFQSHNTANRASRGRCDSHNNFKKPFDIRSPFQLFPNPQPPPQRTLRARQQPKAITAFHKNRYSRSALFSLAPDSSSDARENQPKQRGFLYRLLRRILMFPLVSSMSNNSFCAQDIF